MSESSEATITLAGDLHARPAGALSVAAAKFDAAVEVIVGTSQANAKSVLAVMQLGASSGQQVTIRATGADAVAAVAAIIGILAGATKAGD
jgi:phosphotransferase system HPr (HPr) family protein